MIYKLRNLVSSLGIVHGYGTGRHKEALTSLSLQFLGRTNASYVPRRWHFSNSHDHHYYQQSWQHKGETVFRLGLAADIGLAAGKAITGYLSGSTAILADAAHSVSDVILSGVALVSFKAGKVPKDKEHPYGHGKFESLGALGISCILLATAGGVAWHAFETLLGCLSVPPEMVTSMASSDHIGEGHAHGIDMDHPILALSMTIIAICAKEGLYHLTIREGEIQKNGLMKANAWHHRADAVSSAVALVGVGGSILGVKLLDPLAGLFVSGMILKAGLETGYHSVMELVDAAIPPDDIDSVKKTIIEVKGVEGCHRLRGRRAGSFTYLDIHIEVDPFTSVSAAHEIGESVRQQIQRSHPHMSEVFIHIDPAYLYPGSTQLIQSNSTDAISCELETKARESLSKFCSKTEVRRIIYHEIQGRKFVEIEVAMPWEMAISDAAKIAEAAEGEILKAAPHVSQLCFHLILSRPLPTFPTSS